MRRATRGQTGSAIAANALPSLLTIAEDALTVAQLATTNLWWAEPAEQSRLVAREMESLGYDVAPVRDERPHSYVDRLDLVDSIGTVRDAAKPIDISMLVTAELSLVDAIRALASARYFFVLESNRLAGVVTWSDLQRPAVSMVLFSLIVAGEQAMNSAITAAYPEGWKSHLSTKRWHDVRRIYQDRIRHNTNISPLECLMLEDRLALLAKRPTLWRSLDFRSRADFERWSSKLKEVRNVLAHGGGLLDAEGDPVRAVGLFDDVRAFTEKVWSPHWRKSTSAV